MLINNDTIIKDNNPLIREKSLPVSLPLSEEDQQILRDMLKYVEDSTDEEIAERENLRPAVGISAIQIGIPKQLTAIVVNDYDQDGNEISYKYMLANPKIVSSSVQKAYLKGGEGCLSVEKEHEGFVVRSARVTVTAYDLLSNKNVKLRLRGYLAIVFQHEIDHFSGTLFYDKINKKDPFHRIKDAIEI